MCLAKALLTEAVHVFSQNASKQFIYVEPFQKLAGV